MSTNNIYNHKIIKEMRGAAETAERLLAQQLKRILRDYDLVTKYSKLDKILSLLLGDGVTEIFNIENRFRNSKTGIVTVQVDGKRIELDPKRSQEFYNLAKNENITQAQLLGIVYEQEVHDSLIEKLSNTISTNLDGFLNSKLKVDSGVEGGPYDIVLKLPEDILLTEEQKKQLKSLRSEIHIDVKTRLSFFPITSLGEGARFFMLEQIKDLLKENKQMALFPRESLEDILILNALIYKIKKDNNYPVYYGAVDKDFLLSSQLLSPGYGDFVVKYQMPNEDDVITNTIKKTKGKSNINDKVLWTAATEEIINQIKRTSISYGKTTN